MGLKQFYQTNIGNGEGWKHKGAYAACAAVGGGILVAGLLYLGILRYDKGQVAENIGQLEDKVMQVFKQDSEKKYKF
tara:strand:+ start:11 stop:241 length:231 start_codon:yes stop_codon:yes gene_type:complete